MSARSISRRASSRRRACAAGGNEDSQEYEPGGHGLFTYALLESLKGPADADGDGKVSLAEAFAHLAPMVEKLRVPKLRQTPQLISPDVLKSQTLALTGPGR